eukprot:IDg6038t1
MMEILLPRSFVGKTEFIEEAHRVIVMVVDVFTNWSSMAVAKSGTETL